MKQQKTIAVAYDLNFRQAGEILRGVSEHMQKEALNWRLVPLQYGFETTLMQLAQSGQLSGAIGSFISDQWIQGLLECDVLAINLFRVSDIKSIPSVCLDDTAIARKAAEHLVAQGATQFIYFANGNTHADTFYEQGFNKALKADPCISLKPGPLLGESISAVLQNGHTVGVFCTSDRLAREFITEANRQSLSCGRDYRLVSIGNDPTESVFAGTGITSFNPPMYTCGVRAAKLLEESLSGHMPAPRVYTISQTELLVRESSLASRSARIAQAAANYINEHFFDPTLDAGKLARAIGVSRRVLELSLQDTELPSPYQLISQARLQEASDLLSQTDLPVSEIGRRSGYPEPHHFSAWFKARTEQCPRNYRRYGKPASV